MKVSLVQSSALHSFLLMFVFQRDRQRRLEREELISKYCLLCWNISLGFSKHNIVLHLESNFHLGIISQNNHVSFSYTFLLPPTGSFSSAKPPSEIIHALHHGFLKVLGLKCIWWWLLLWRNQWFPLWVISLGSIRTRDFGQWAKIPLESCAKELDQFGREQNWTVWAPLSREHCSQGCLDSWSGSCS